VDVDEEDGPDDSHISPAAVVADVTSVKNEEAVQRGRARETAFVLRRSLTISMRFLSQRRLTRWMVHKK
jgi:hypothetical protein